MYKILFAFVILLISSTVLADDIPENGARVVSDIREFNIKGNGYIYSVHKKLLIYNKKGQEYGSLSILENSHSHLKKVLIRVSDENGSEIYSHSKKDMTKVCGYDGTSLYNDDCTYYMELNAPAFPYYIEYDYIQEFESLFFLQGVWVDRDIPIDRLSYSLIYPAGFAFQSKLDHMDLQTSTVSTIDGVVTKWEVANLPALKKATYLPYTISRDSWLKLAAERYTFDDYAFGGLSWQEIGRFYNKMAEKKYSETKDSAVNPKTIKEIYDNVIDNIRYVAIQIGVGGWQPYEADLTRERMFGDCKDMSTLLISDLRQNGYTAYPALVLTRDEGPIDVDFPQNRFNHVICFAIVDNDTIWMDPTCDFCPYGDIPVSDEDIKVLAIDEEGGRIVTTPSSGADDNQVIRNTEIHIGSDYFYNINCELTVTGEIATRYRYYISGADKDEQSRLMDVLFDTKDNHLKISSYHFEYEDSIYLPLKIIVSAVSLKQIDRLGGKSYINPFVFNKPSGIETLDLDKRTLPLRINFPYSVSDSISLSWDDTLKVDSVILPENDSLRTDFGMLDFKSAEQADKVAISFGKKYFNYQIIADQIEEFSQFCKKLDQLTSRNVKLLENQ